MTYEWRCQLCGEVVEVIRKLAERGEHPSLLEHSCPGQLNAFATYERVVSKTMPRFPGADGWRRN